MNKGLLFIIAMVVIFVVGIWYYHRVTEMEYKRILKVIAMSPITAIVFIWGWLHDKN